MADFTYQGESYEVWIRPWKKGNKKYEAIKWKTGFRNLWENIPYEDYLKIQRLTQNKQ
jgi:hypothetical protein